MVNWYSKKFFIINLPKIIAKFISICELPNWKVILHYQKYTRLTIMVSLYHENEKSYVLTNANARVSTVFD